MSRNRRSLPWGENKKLSLAKAANKVSTDPIVALQQFRAELQHRSCGNSQTDEVLHLFSQIERCTVVHSTRAKKWAEFD